MDGKDIVKVGPDLKDTSAKDGFSGEEKESELPGAFVSSYDQLINDAALDSTPPSNKNGKIRWVSPWL